MYMAYTTNPKLPKLRMEAVRLAKYRGWSTRRVAKYTGYNQSTIVRWCSKDPTGGWRLIPTQSSRPHHHPHELSSEVVEAILNYREKYRRCAEVIHHLLQKDGREVSLASVKRVLKRHGCSRFSRWKKWHQYPPRPLPGKPGILVQIDTIVDGPHTDRLYVYTLLDVCSRWAYALPELMANTHKSLRFVETARSIAPFSFTTLQSDHGAEFSKWFTKRIMERGLSHRHSRVRTPSDNGHLERFNRTLQEECLQRIPRSLKSYRKEIPEYLAWYNTKRPHMGLDMKSPIDVLKVMRSY